MVISQFPGQYLYQQEYVIVLFRKYQECKSMIYKYIYLSAPKASGALCYIKATVDRKIAVTPILISLHWENRIAPLK